MYRTITVTFAANKSGNDYRIAQFFHLHYHGMEPVSIMAQNLEKSQLMPNGGAC